MRHINTIDESKLYFGDNLDVMDELPAYSIDLIITDPPYCFSKHNGKMQRGENEKTFSGSSLYDYNTDDGMCRIKEQFNRDDIYRWLDMTKRLMKKMNAYIFCCEDQIPAYGEWAVQNGYKFAILIWQKSLGIINKRRFAQDTEFIIRIYDLGTGLNSVDDCELYSRVITTPSLHKKEHPTQKPIGIMERFVRLSSREGDVVLDPFLGSGTTAVAAKRLGRKYIGIENNERFFRIAENRLKREGEQQSLF